jgi:hypothetical protein
MIFHPDYPNQSSLADRRRYHGKALGENTLLTCKGLARDPSSPRAFWKWGQPLEIPYAALEMD